MQAPPLPVWATVKQSYGWVRHHPRLLVLPMAILFSVEFLGDIASAHWLTDTWGKIAAALLLSVVEAAFCVGLHRTVIIDEVRSGFAFLRWGFELWRYLKTILLVGLGAIFIFVVVALPLAALLGGPDLRSEKGILVACIAGFAVFYPLVRLFLVLPAAALGQDKAFRWSWNATSGNMLRLVAILLMTMLPAGLISGLLELPFDLSAKQPLSYLFALLSTGFDVLGTAFSTNALSFSYLKLAPPPAPSAEPAP